MSKKKFGIVVFPGSNCDRDCYYVLKNILAQDVSYLWHKEENLNNYDCIILPGGFSYGDYLRTGAIARFSPIMKAINKYVKNGGLVLGICNGFQILLEGGFLPGAMITNKNLHFICKYVYIRVENNQTPFTTKFKKGEILKIPIAHKEGNYCISKQMVEKIKPAIVFRYCDRKGEITPESNPNGSFENIAGICNLDGKVMGMMPHPERASEKILGSQQGIKIFQSVIENG